jgi:hypothetical protein
MPHDACLKAQKPRGCDSKVVHRPRKGWRNPRPQAAGMRSRREERKLPYARPRYFNVGAICFSSAGECSPVSGGRCGVRLGGRTVTSSDTTRRPPIVFGRSVEYPCAPQQWTIARTTRKSVEYRCVRGRTYCPGAAIKASIRGIPTGRSRLQCGGRPPAGRRPWSFLCCSQVRSCDASSQPSSQYGLP